MKEELEKLIAKIEAERREALEIMEGHPNLTYANHEFLLGKRVAFDYVLDQLQILEVQ